MLAQANDIERTWGPGKPGRQILTALTVAAGGNVTGGAGQFAANAAIGYAQSLGANKVKELADSFGQGTPQAESVRAALHTIVGCAGAAAGGQGCGSGAMGAAASSLIGSALGSAERLTEQERQARVDLVMSIVAGVAAAGGLDGATAGNAAKIEGENNWGAIVVPGAGSAMAGGAGQHVPQGMGGYFGEQRQNGDGVIVDNATDLDPSAKAGAIITPRGGGSGFNLTGPFTKFDQSDTNYVKGATADTASMVSNTAGWISSTAATGAAVPSPFAPAFGTIAYGATVVGIGADAVSQLVSPHAGQYTYEGALALGGQVIGDKILSRR
ncbi:filamentous hemagglutinin family outer membrane domain protein [Burkholderia cenocepacia]|nr:filamentous hemagglutinin family outer membrane domain protein [Burkholderia cenocepacia]